MYRERLERLRTCLWFVQFQTVRVRPLRPWRSVSRIRVVRSSDPTGIQVHSEILDRGSCCFYTQCLGGAQARVQFNCLRFQTHHRRVAKLYEVIMLCLPHPHWLPEFSWVFSSSRRSWHWHKVYSWKNIRCKHVPCLYRPAERGHVDNPSGK